MIDKHGDEITSHGDMVDQVGVLTTRGGQPQEL